MTVLVQMLLTALMAVTTENILFGGGMGISRVLRVARRPKLLVMYSALIAFFSLASVLFSTLFSPLILGNDAVIFLRPAVFAVSAAAVYLITAAVLRGFFPGLYKRCGQALPFSAINTVVLSMPYVQKSFKLNLPDAVAFAVGTGVAFFLAAAVLYYAVARYQSDDMPKAFRGLPAVLIYIGILSLAFAGLTGGKLF
jgi:Na+-translocating ferredoxin:NAD+ oxidoreductase subunit A